MKRAMLFLLIFAVAFSLSACARTENTIEGHEWRMRYVMHEEGESLIVDAVAEPDPAHPTAKIVDLTLAASSGILTITDHTNGQSYHGTYVKSDTTPKGTSYTITIEGESGYAFVGPTTYADGTEVPTLPITLPPYAIYLYAE